MTSTPIRTAALLVAVATATTALSGQSTRARREVEIIGHRGAAGLAPENTLAAFRRACAIGVTGIELDVHLTADSVLVVHHDYTLHPDHTRDAAGAYSIGEPRPLLRQLTVAQLRMYDVGQLRPGSDYAKRHPLQEPHSGERVPTLDEVITLFKAECAPPTRLVVEIKTDPTRPELSAPPALLAERTVTQLRRRGVANRAQIIAFDWRAVMRVQQIAADMPTSYLTYEGRDSTDWNTIEIGRAGAAIWMGGIDVDAHGGSVPRAIAAAGGRHWSPHFRNLTAERIAEAHALGLRVYPWTVDDPADMKAMIELGVDGITTDRPDLLRDLLATRGYGARVASHRPRATTESGLSASVFTEVPTSFPSFRRPTERKFIMGPFGLAGFAYGAVDVTIMLSPSNIRVNGMAFIDPSMVSLPLASSTLSLVQRAVTESLVSPIDIPFHLPETSEAVSRTGAGVIATAVVSAAGVSAFVQATSTKAKQNILRMEPSLVAVGDRREPFTTGQL
jgi:glycerophosphoryl diester phosphodiesterase